MTEISGERLRLAVSNTLASMGYHLVKGAITIKTPTGAIETLVFVERKP